jgi:hypothetical protein
MMRKILLLTLLFLIVITAACQASPPAESAEIDTPAADTPTLEVASPAASPTSVEPTATTQVIPTEAATFEATMAAEPTAEPTTAPATAAPETATGFCPEVTRPALILFIPGEKYILTNPLTGETCDLTFPEPNPGSVQAAREAANESLFYYAAEGEGDGVVAIHRLQPDGTVTPLPFTALDNTQRSFTYGFVVSEDSSLVAWSSSSVNSNDQGVVASDLWVANVATGQVTQLASNRSTANSDGFHRGLLPIRFSDDNTLLVYTLQPIGIGGAWSSFVGNYDSLMTISATGGEPTVVFDCAAEGLFLCIGDFDMFGREFGTIVYVDPEAQAIIARQANGDLINTLNVADEYVAYPTFSPNGELIFYSADLSETSILPDAAHLHRAAPINAPAELVVSDPLMIPPRMFLDASHAVVGYTDENGNFGQALANIHQGTLTPLAEWPSAIATGVLREPPPPPEPLHVFGDGVEFLVDPSLARDVRYDLVPRATEEDVGGFTFSAWPEHRMLTFLQPYFLPETLYRQTVNLYTEPRVFIFPAAEYMEINSIAAEQIPQLQELLANQPADVEGELSYLPPPNGSQVFHAQEAYLTFEGGKGIRYLTIFNQEPREINNAELFYTFQGLTDDGRYYISASFPVAAPNLPETSEIEDMDAFATNFAQYVADTTQELDGLTTADFTPDLATLDAVVQSLRFTTP